MSRQSIVLVLAIAIWAVACVPAFDAMIASYAAAWLCSCRRSRRAR